MQNLVVRIKNSNSDTEPLQLTWQDTNQQHNTQSLLQTAKQANQIIVLVPTTDINLTTADLPKLKTNQLLKALPYELEENLAAKTDNLHFALCPYNKLRPLPVAVVSQNRLEIWQHFLKSQLQQYCHKVKYFIPDVLALPYEPHTIYITVEENIALIRTDKYSGFATDADNLITVLQLWLQPKNTVSAAIEAYVNNQNIKQQLQQRFSNITFVNNTPAMLQHYATLEEKPLNLLQGKYTATHRVFNLNKLNWAAALVVAVWMLTLTAIDGLEWINLKQQNHNLQQQINLIYKTVYSQQQVPSNPRKSLNIELEQLRQRYSDSKLIQMLAITEENLANIGSHLELQRLDFQNQQLQLQLQTTSVAAIEQLQQNFVNHGLNATISEVARVGNEFINASLTISENL